MKNYFVYIMTNDRNTVLYTGITSNLTKRSCEHKNKVVEGFTSKYNIKKLVYFEEFSSPTEAIAFEKKIKAGSRKKKERLVDSINKEWKDLSKEWVADC